MAARNVPCSFLRAAALRRSFSHSPAAAASVTAEQIAEKLREQKKPKVVPEVNLWICLGIVRLEGGGLLVFPSMHHGETTLPSVHWWLEL